MRILFLIRSNFHYTSELANALVAGGQEVIVVARDQDMDFVGLGGDPKQDYREILDDRIVLEWVHIPSDTRIGTLMDNMRSSLHIASVVRRYRPDIIHIYDARDYRLLSAILYNRARRTPVVLTVHDAELHPGDKANRQNAISAWNRRVANALIVHGEDIKQRLLANGDELKDKVRVIPRGPYSIYRRWEATEFTKPETKEVLFFGRVLLYKGLEYLIKCAPAVCREVPDARFVIAGAGPDWARCRELIGNPECFVLREEKVPEPKVTELFQRASVVVLPYIEASQSGVLFIAYALGRPVIVTDVGSLPEVVDDGQTGFVVPPRDSEALSKAIVQVLKDDGLRESMERNAYNKVASGDLSWKSIATRTTALYEEIASGSRR